MDELLGKLPILIIIAIAAVAQWLAQAREAQRRARQAAAQTEGSEPQAARRRSPRALRPGPAATRVGGAEPQSAPEQVRDRHLPQGHSDLIDHHLAAAAQRGGLTSPFAPEPNDVHAPKGPRSARESIVPGEPSALRRALLHVDVLGPPLALRRRPRRR